MRMPFGKFAGKSVADIPSAYLAWVLDECTNVDLALRRAIIAEMVKRRDWREEEADDESEPEASTALVHPGVAAWKENWRRICQIGHPDKGGDESLFKILVGINLEMSKASRAG
jgi:hypothetical protein